MTFSNHKMIVYAILFAFLILAPGCGGGGGGGIPSASKAFTRPELTASQRAHDVLTNTGLSDMGAASPIYWIYNMSDVYEYLGSYTESYAEEPFTGRGAMRKRGSLLELIQVSQYLKKHHTMTREPIDETSSDGWHWVGSDSSSDTSGTLTLTGTKGANTVKLTASGSGNEVAWTSDLTWSGKISTSKGVCKLTVTYHQFESDAALNFSVTACTTLADNIASSMSYSGTAIPNEDGDYYNTFVLTVNGKESIIAQDGYWVNTTFSDWKLLTDIMYYYGSSDFMSGTIAFTASDGFHGSLSLSNGEWTGQVFDTANTKVADITGEVYDFKWSVDYTTQGVPNEEIDYGLN